MGLFNAFTASVSGMTAQANMLSAISDNIANANTTGYKEASTDFQDMLNQMSTTDYNAAGVGTVVKYNISKQGDLSGTSSSTDLAIKGNGFFIVSDNSGAMYLTRAGSFTPDSSGNLVNSSGYTLMGYSLASGSSGVTYTTSGLVPVTTNSSALKASPSTSGTLNVNLNSNAAVISSPSTTNYTSMTSVQTYDNLGNAVPLDIYYSNLGGNNWEMDVYQNGTSISSTGLSFDGNGTLTSPSPGTVSVTTSGGNMINFDVSDTTQLASAWSVNAATADGNAPSSVKSVNIGADGTLSFVYSDGTSVDAYKIPLGNVVSPDHMDSQAGDVFVPNSESGQMTIGTANSGAYGSINASELESSTVDLATQLTNMIVAQRGYEANSKAFETSSTLLEELNNLVK